MTAYRSRYGELQGAEVIAISTDSLDTQRKFKRALRAQYPLVADPKGHLVRLFDVKLPALDIARRQTFVIGPDHTVVHVDVDDEAVDPSSVVRAVAVFRDDSMPRW